MVQLGLSGNWARWDNPRFVDDSGIGGFTRVSIADLQITVDVTSGNLGTRGFVNVAYVFGGPQRRNWRCPDTSGFVDRPQDWLTRPVIRDVSLRVQEVAGVPGRTAGNDARRRWAGAGGGGAAEAVEAVDAAPAPTRAHPAGGERHPNLCSLQVDPAQDQINSGVIDPGDGFNLLVQFTNGTTQTATNISTTNLSATAPFVVFNSPTTEVISSGNLPPGSVVSNVIASSNMGIDPTATQGSQFSLDFDVTVDGQTRRFRCGPITLGTSGNATPAAPAIPLN